ncbi:MAG: SusC/RagA family TonB-linked outer membrane protein [Bacteroidales bacterium]|nr:SusC/RagA family TonB-linked outer membrane protein [Bacteroidales bacterium]
MKRKQIVKLVAIICFVLTGNILLAQNVVTGKVNSAVEAEGPIPGATVVVVGTSVGISTDMDGNYRITVPEGATALKFSFIGYQDLEVPINGRSRIDVVLQHALEDAGEVVVTALGIRTEKKALGYSVTEVNSEDIVAAKSTSFAEALSGKVSGMQITSVGGQVGSGTRIVLRGGSSINGNNQPLFVVNGVPFDAAIGGQSSGLADIDPASIDNISVLKGAAASALYGSRAANGVVLITTKSGSFNSKPQVTFSHSTSFDKIWEMPLNEIWAQGQWSGTNQEWTYYDGETQKSSSSWGPRISDLPGAELYDRWQIFDTGITLDNSLSVTGGNEQASYYLSVSDYNNTGVLPTQGFRRNSINANTKFKFTDKLTVSSNVMYSRQTGQRMAEGGANNDFMNSLQAAPTTWNPNPIYDDNGDIRLYRGGGRDPYLWVLENFGREISRDRMVASVTLEYQIADHFKFRSTSGVSTTSYTYEDHKNKGGIYTVNGSFDANESFNREMESTNLVMYDNKFGDISVDAFVGQNIVDEFWRSSSFNGDGLVVPGIYNANNVSSYTANSSYGQFRSFSLFGEVRLAYQSLLYYTATYRRDWASSVNNNYGYPSHSLGLVFSELLPANTVLTFGKFRASYAKVGAPAGAYANNVRLSQAGGLGVTWPFNGQASFLPSSTFPNTELTNEFTSEIEFGFDLKFFQNRLGIDAAYYHNWSTNQILWESMLNSTSFSGGNINIGGITHKGLELSFYGTPIKTSDFSWDVTLNWAQDNSMVDKLGENDEPLGIGGGGTAVVGQPYPVIYGEGFLRDDQGRLIVNDAGSQGDDRSIFANYIRDPRGSMVLGKIAPDWFGGLRNTFTYKSISLTAQIDFQKGGIVNNFVDAYLSYYGMSKHQESRPDDNRTILPGVMGHYDYTAQEAVVSDDTPNTEWTPYTRFYQNFWNLTEKSLMPADYIKLRELVIAYDLPSSLTERAHMQAVRVSFSGRNLWRKFHKDYYGSDPDLKSGGVSNGNAWNVYGFPSMKTYTLSVNVTF